MFKSLKRNPTDLDKNIDALYKRMYQIDLGSDEYPRLLSHVERLEKLKTETRSKKRPSPDTVLSVAGSLAGIAVIVGYERANVVTSKAVSFIPKFR